MYIRYLCQYAPFTPDTHAGLYANVFRDGSGRAYPGHALSASSGVDLGGLEGVAGGVREDDRAGAGAGGRGVAVGGAVARSGERGVRPDARRGPPDVGHRAASDAHSPAGLDPVRVHEGRGPRSRAVAASGAGRRRFGRGVDPGASCACGPRTPGPVPSQG